MIPLDLYEWHAWLREESREIQQLHAEKKDDEIFRCFLDGYHSHYKHTCKQFADMVKVSRLYEARKN